MASPTSYSDTQEHYGCIIMGAGMSGLATAIQLQRKYDFTDVVVYEKQEDVGGTWSKHGYPGCACDVPVGLYSFSFEPKGNFGSQWGSSDAIWSYIKGVQSKYSAGNRIVYRTAVKSASFSRATGLWSVTVKDLVTGETRQRTCNILISAVGVLSIPKDPPFDTSKFEGSVVHSGAWDPQLELGGKDVLVVGNGCSAAQLIPAIVDEVGSLTQVARTRQSFLPVPPVPDGALYMWMINWIPGFFYLMRLLIFLFLEADFRIMDVKKGARGRQKMHDAAMEHMKANAPEKYWDDLMPEFEVGAKRRVLDRVGYYKSLEKVELISGQSIVSAEGKTVVTNKGVKINAEVVILCTGFKVQDYLFPLEIINEESEGVRQRLGSEKKAYQGTCISNFPNFFMLLGPNTATGHSSALFTSECQMTLILQLIAPIIAKIRKLEVSESPAPTVEVTADAEQAFFDSLRKEMKEKVWERDPVGWYVDNTTGKCTTNYPWSQIHFWRATAWVNRKHFKWIGC